MPSKTIHTILTFCIAAVWLVNGLFCKLLNLAPRHEQIVARILGDGHAVFFTKAIGIAEIAMTVWIVSRIQTRVNTWLQIIIIATMNIIEFILAPDLLLWGRLNAVFALLFIILIYFNEFHFNKKQGRQP